MAIDRRRVSLVRMTSAEEESRCRSFYSFIPCRLISFLACFCLVMAPKLEHLM